MAVERGPDGKFPPLKQQLKNAGNAILIGIVTAIAIAIGWLGFAYVMIHYGPR